jgi:glutaredoxin-related protein
VNLDLIDNGKSLHSELILLTSIESLPMIFVGAQHLGGFSALEEFYEDGTLVKLLNNAEVTHSLKMSR